MPIVQYIHNGSSITKKMLTPKSITKVEKWYKEAQRVIPSIPIALLKTFGNNTWCIEYVDIDIKWIKFDLLSVTGDKAYIVILR